MSDFDAIVVGAGCAGSVAAYTLASAGKSVLVVESWSVRWRQEHDRMAVSSYAFAGQGFPESPIRKLLCSAR